MDGRQEILVTMLEGFLDRLRDPSFSISGIAVDKAIEYGRRMSEPMSRIMTTRMVADELGVTERTVRTYVTLGLLAQPSKLKGCNAKLWTSDDVDAAKTNLRKYGYRD